MEQEKIVNGNCWVAYFDILGFKNQIHPFRGHLDSYVKVQYEEILQRIEKDKQGVSTFTPDVHEYCCFSDSFLFYASGDSIQSYLTIHFVATGFFHYMAIVQKRPITGAISVGDFYANKTKTIYLGEALNDAHTYAEKQDWIGLVLTPSARTKLESDGHDPFVFAHDFREYDVPIKLRTFVNGVKRIEVGCEKLLAHRYEDSDARHKVFVDWIKSKYMGSRNTEYGNKYRKTLSFYGIHPDRKENQH
jgi:hypothetical protein